MLPPFPGFVCCAPLDCHHSSLPFTCWGPLSSLSPGSGISKIPHFPNSQGICRPLHMLTYSMRYPECSLTFFGFLSSWLESQHAESKPLGLFLLDACTVRRSVQRSTGLCRSCFLVPSLNLLFWNDFHLLLGLFGVRKGSPKERGFVNSFIKNFIIF